MKDEMVSKVLVSQILASTLRVLADRLAPVGGVAATQAAR